MNGRIENYDGNRDAGVEVVIQYDEVVVVDDVIDVAPVTTTTEGTGTANVVSAAEDAVAASDAGAAYVVDSADEADAVYVVGTLGDAGAVGFVDVVAAADDGAVGYGEPNGSHLLRQDVSDDYQHNSLNISFDLFMGYIELLSDAIRTGSSPETIAELRAHLASSMSLCRYMLSKLNVTNT